MISLDGATFLLQWASGGLGFLWVTTRRREVGARYGWLLRASYGLIAVGAFLVGAYLVDPVPVRDLASLGVATTAAIALALSVTRRERFAPWLDLLAPVIGFVGIVGAGLEAGGPAWLSVARFVVGAAFLGAVTDAMLLGHWYLVQPGLPRAPLLELVRWSTVLSIPEILLLVVPTGMISVLNGSIDDNYNGLLGWFWLACAITTVCLLVVTRLALRERAYSAVMAATGLLYLAILTAFGTDLVARALLRAQPI